MIVHDVERGVDEVCDSVRKADLVGGDVETVAVFVGPSMATKRTASFR